MKKNFHAVRGIQRERKLSSFTTSRIEYKSMISPALRFALKSTENKGVSCLRMSLNEDQEENMVKRKTTQTKNY
jgi:hypothetical protein